MYNIMKYEEKLLICSYITRNSNNTSLMRSTENCKMNVNMAIKRLGIDYNYNGVPRSTRVHT